MFCLYQNNTESSGSQLCAFLMHVPPGNHSETVSREGEEILFLLEGEITQWLDGAEIVRRAGDARHFCGNQRHAWANRAATPARRLWTGTRGLFKPAGGLASPASETPEPPASFPTLSKGEKN